MGGLFGLAGAGLGGFARNGFKFVECGFIGYCQSQEPQS